MNRQPASDPSHPSSAAEMARYQLAFDLGVRKTRDNIRRLADEPKSAAWAVDGNFFDCPEGFYEIGNWTSSFFTGMALLAWRATGDECFLKQTLRLAPAYQEKADARQLDTHHDLGFLYSLYSVALYRLTGDKKQRETGLRAATLLARRFNPRGGFIRAWGRADTDEYANLAIIDSLMNLPLLHWAAQETGDSSYREVAVCHADNVARNFIRPDDSLCHAFRFDLASGRPSGPENFCGRSVDSHWARGTAWAIYGFALNYGYAPKEVYLQSALRLAKKFVAELDAEVVPVWDFRLPAGAEPLRDASAAAIAVCGLQELARHGVADRNLQQAKRALLNRVCADDYLDFDERCPGLLRCAYGDQTAYSSWGDYFLMEALDRELHQHPTWW